MPDPRLKDVSPFTPDGRLRTPIQEALDRASAFTRDGRLKTPAKDALDKVSLVEGPLTPARTVPAP
jgi:hypothetical protein